MSLRIKMLGAMALILAISVGGSLLVLIQYQRAQFLRNTADATTHLTNTIKATLEHAMLTRDPSEIQRIVRTVGQQPGVEGVFILDHNGVVKVASDLDQVGRLLREGQPAWPADIQGGQRGERSLTTVLQHQPSPVLRITSLVPNASRCQSCHPANQQVLGALVVDRSLAQMEQQLRAGLAYMLGSAGLVFLLLTGTTYAALRRLVITPLAQLGEAARAIEAGKYDTPMAAHSTDEVGDLARTLDEMRRRIEERTRDLQATNLKLMVEITARKRTEEIRQALYESSREIQAPQPIEDRLARLLGTARDVLHLDRVNVLLADPDGQWLQAVASLGTQEPLGTIRVPIGPEGGGLAQAYQTQETVVWDGQTPVPEALRLKPPYDRIEAFRSRVFAIVPLVVQGRAIGVLGADRKHSRQPIEPDTLELLQLFASLAAPAIEHARLYDATVRQLRELRALYESGLAITSSLTLDEQLEVLIQRLGQVAQAQRILVALVDAGDPERFRLCLAHDATRGDPWLRHLDLSSGRYPEIQDAMRTGRPLVIPDVPAEARLDAIRNHLKNLDLRSLIVVPLIVQERAIGAVSLGYVGQGRTFSPEEVSLFQSFATQAAIAIEKARLYEEIQHHAADLEQRVQERTRELEAANEQLQAASRHKSEFLANMSHELRTPLNSIIGFAELVGEQRVGPLNEKQARYLGHIHTSGKHLLQIISDILDLSKVEAGKFTFRPEPLPVAGTLQDILVIARGLANKKKQELSAEIEATLPPLRADPVRFKQILFNLLSNAVKFTPEGGRITLTARKASGVRRKAEPAGTGGTGSTPLTPYASPLTDFLEIAVTDTGIGIKSEDLPRLFQEFVQLDATASKRDEGTGLGLALTKRLVELHGGRIRATSPGEGQGSTFTVLLPVEGPRA